MSRPPTIAHLAIATLAIIAVLSPVEAALDTVDAVVPESASAVDNDLTPKNPYNEEIQEPIKTLQQHAHTQSQEDTIKALEGQLQSLVAVQATPANTETDGGTAALAARVETMASGINAIVDTMQAGLTSDHQTGSSDLTTLLGAINSTQRDVTSAEKASVLLKAQKWCTAKGQLDNATTKCSDASTAHTNFDPAISVGDAFYKYIGDITDCKHDTTLVNGKCPETQPNLDATTIKLGFQNARDEYHRLDTVKATECATKQSSTTDESTNATAMDSEINAILDGHVGGCDPDHTVFTTAVSAFNTNNQHRASMYKALDKVSCMVTNINVSATATTNCIDGLDDDSVYAAKFPDHTTTPPTCPTRAQYATQISNFQSLSLSTTWVPNAATCNAVATQVVGGACAFPMKQGDACAAEWSQHPTGYKCTYGQIKQGSINNCYVGSRYKINMGTTTDAQNRYTFSDGKLQQCVDSCQTNYGNGSPSNHEHSNCEGYGGADVKYGGFAMMGDNKCYCYASSGVDGATVIKNAEGNYLNCVKQ